MGRECGYAGRILRVDLSLKSTSDLSTTDYADAFIGGEVPRPRYTGTRYRPVPRPLTLRIASSLSPVP